MARLVEYSLGDAGLAWAGQADRREAPHGVELQAEAAGWAPDGLGIWHVAEGAHATIWYVPCVEVEEPR